MILESIKYTRSQGKPKEWTIMGWDGNPVHFENINLIVGKNAAGKSRTLAIMKDISALLSENAKIASIPYDCYKYEIRWLDNGNSFDYYLEVDNHTVKEEKLSVNEKDYLIRSEKLIFSEQTGSMEAFDIKPTVLAVTLSSNAGYPYLKKMKDWGKSLKQGPFTNQIEKNYILDDLEQLESFDELTSTSPIYLLHAFWTGKRLYGNSFVDVVKANMKNMNYPIEMIDILEGAVGYGLYVKEDELEEATSQIEMSQGMYRTLSFIIHLNLALQSKISACVLVDDLGEGLDFDRSKLLIDLLIKQINNSDIQMFITTNDRYIMNKMPLKYWSIIERYPKKSVFYNYQNSKSTFEDFKYTGLNNFDFLATDFYLNGFDSAED